MKVYTIFNIGIAGSILAIFLWCGFFANHTPKTNCDHLKLLGKACPVCNVDLGLHLLLQGDLEEAKKVQPWTLRLFLFLIFQLAVRVTILLILRLRRYNVSTIYKTDLFVNLIVLSAFYATYLMQVGYLYYKILLTNTPF